MKTILLIILFLFGVSSVSYTQENINQDEMIGFGCYYSGEQSKTVKKVTRRLKNKNYTSIVKMLTSDNNAERYMAVITLEKLNDLNRYKISETNKKLITGIRNSTELVSVCSGCTFFGQVELNKMFTTDLELFAYNWLNHNFK